MPCVKGNIQSHQASSSANACQAYSDRMQDWVIRCATVNNTCIRIQSRSSKTAFRNWTEPSGPADYYRNLLAKRTPVASAIDFADLEWYKTSVYSLHVSVSFPISNLCNGAPQHLLSFRSVLCCSLELTDAEGNVMHHTLLRAGRSSANDITSLVEEHSILPSSLLAYRMVYTDKDHETGIVTYEGLVGPFSILSHSLLSMGKVVPSRFRVSVFADLQAIIDSSLSGMQFLCQAYSPTFFVKSKKPVQTAGVHRKTERATYHHQLLVPAAKRRWQPGS
eukprot:ANDGO_06873.mRNA.1 hypothetical protein